MLSTCSPFYLWNVTLQRHPYAFRFKKSICTILSDVIVVSLGALMSVVHTIIKTSTSSTLKRKVDPGRWL